MVKAQLMLILLLSSEQKPPDSKSRVLFNKKRKVQSLTLSPTRWGTSDMWVNFFIWKVKMMVPTSWNCVRIQQNNECIIPPSTTLSLKVFGLELYIVTEEGQWWRTHRKLMILFQYCVYTSIYSIFIIFSPKLSTISPIVQMRKRQSGRLGTYSSLQR